MKNRLFWLLIVLLSGVVFSHAEKIEMVPIYKAGADGYHTYRIPVLIVTTNKTVLAFCEGRENGRNDTGNIDLLVKRSTDSGKTWGPQIIVWSDGNTCGNPTPVIDQATGFIWLLMTWNNGADTEKQINAGTGKDTRRVFVTHSEDDGKFWAKPTEITSAVKKPEWHWYATGPVNGIQLLHGPHAGRLVIPCNHSGAKGDPHAGSISHVIYSDDHGATWKLGGSQDERTNESTVAELPDGVIMDNSRSYRQKKVRAVALSKDGGDTWSHVEDTRLIEPVCEGSLLRYSWATGGDKSRLLFSNPASEKRENETVRISYDEGQTWSSGLSLHPGPSAYSCLTVLPDNTIGCAFECGEKGPYETITMAFIPLKLLEAAKN